jgi:hypothetical protein
MKNRQTTRVDQTIEPGGRGLTYQNHDGFSVYQHGVYPRQSVLAGQHQRIFVAHYATLAEAQAAHPDARVIPGTTFTPPNLSHLPDDGDY